MGFEVLIIWCRAVVLTPGPGEPQVELGSSLLVLESRRVSWGPHPWSWRAAGCAGVLTPGPGEPQGVLGSSLLALESHRVCWGPHSWSWRAAGCAGVLTPGAWRAAECAGVLTPGLGELQGVLGPHSWSWRAAGCAGVLTPSSLTLIIPVCHFSKKSHKHQVNYSTIEKEVQVLLLELQHCEVCVSSSTVRSWCVQINIDQRTGNSCYRILISRFTTKKDTLCHMLGVNYDIFFGGGCYGSES